MTITEVIQVEPMDQFQYGELIFTGEIHVVGDNLIIPIRQYPPEICCDIDASNIGALVAVFDTNSKTVQYNVDNRLTSTPNYVRIDRDGTIYAVPIRENGFTNHYYNLPADAPSPHLVLKLNQDGTFDTDYSFDLDAALNNNIEFIESVVAVLDNKLILQYYDSRDVDLDDVPFSERYDSRSVGTRSVVVDLSTGEVNDFEAFEGALKEDDYCTVILEAIQGVGGLDEPTTDFYQFVEKKCREQGVVLIADEVQSGFGRSGAFFAFQHHDVRPDIISIAKGMGNGFPVGGILIHKSIKASHGLLGTTFGGNHLACAATLAVLEILEKEKLIENAHNLGTYFKQEALKLPLVKRIKGRGLMLGLEFDFEVADLRKRMIHNQHFFTGGSKNKKVLRILPALNISEKHINLFFQALNRELS